MTDDRGEALLQGAFHQSQSQIYLKEECQIREEERNRTDHNFLS